MDVWGNFFENVLDRIQSGVVLLNSEFGIEYLNRYCLDMLQTERELWTGRSAVELFPELDLNLIREGMLGEVPLSIENLTVRVQDTNHQLAVEISPFLVLGQPVGTLLTFQDKTAALKQQDDIIHAEKMAAIGSMAAGTVHEIRNPLTTVKGFLQLFERDISKFSGMGLIQRGFSDKAKYVFPLLFSEIQKIEQILSNFLLISQPQTSRYSVIRINDFLHSVLPKLQEQGMQGNASLVCQFPTKNIKFFADPDELASVLFHLVNNSLEAFAGDAGEIRVAAQVLADDFVISVSDNGPGIPADINESALDPFVTTKVDHPGLGLSICRQVISRMGGNVYISSQSGIGTTVEMQIPFLHDDILSIDELRPVLKEVAYR